MKNHSDTSVARQNPWGRTPRNTAERAVSAQPPSPSFARLFRWFGETGVDGREAFLDTAPGVMFEHE
jgi:hypothetical protein